MGTQKPKRRTARVALKTKPANAPIVLLLPRHPDELEPRLARARGALRHPTTRPTRPALSLLTSTERWRTNELQSCSNPRQLKHPPTRGSPSHATENEMGADTDEVD
jgi:hypothetical protein